MEKYQDMRVFCFQHGGEYAQKVNEEREKRLQGAWAIRFPFEVKGYPAFIVLNRELHALIASINQKNVQLVRLSRELPAEAGRQFARNAMVEEIQQSNEFENVHSTRREIREAVEALEQGMGDKRFMGMVKKYSMLLERKDISLNNSSDIRRLYDEFILEEVLRENPKNAPDGTVFRRDTNYVSYQGQAIHEGVYPERRVIETMDGALLMLNDRTIDPLVRAAAFHYAFGYIHPFYDGNGRMSRFITSYVLSECEYAESACLRISYIIKNHRQLYQRIFRNANDPRSMGDLTCFVIEFLRLIELALEDTYAVLQEKYRAYEHYQARLQECVNRREKALHKYGSVLWLMMQAKLFGDGYFDVLELAYSCDLSPNTIRRIAGLFPGLIVQEREGNRMMYHLDLEWLDRAEQG